MSVPSAATLPNMQTLNVSDANIKIRVIQMDVDIESPLITIPTVQFPTKLIKNDEIIEQMNDIQCNNDQENAR